MSDTTTTMIMLPGHAIIVDPQAPEHDASLVADFSYPGQGALYLTHIKASVAAAAGNPNSCLIFSGGCTREVANTISEAESYKRTADAAGYWGASGVAARTLLEPHAADSLGNFALSLCCYFATHEAFPGRVVILGFEFKGERFLMHREALRWNREFCYLGINNPPAGAPLEMALVGEARKRAAVLNDPLLLGREWKEQRRRRNPLGQKEHYSEQAPALAPFLNYLGGSGEPVSPPWVMEG